MTRLLLLIVDAAGEIVETFIPPEQPEPTNLAYLETQGCRLVEAEATWADKPE